MVSDDYINGLPEDFRMAVLEITQNIVEIYSYGSDGFTDDEFDELVDFHILLEEFLKSHSYTFQEIALSGNHIDAGRIFDFALSISSDIKEELSNHKRSESRERFSRVFNNSFSYKFTDGDLNRIQDLINELRAEISESDLFEDGHRSRLLRRLEKLQGELHKKVSDLDRFWGLIGDAGVAIGKFGTDAKPIVDRIREIAGIVWRTQSVAEELPSGTKVPFLDSEDEPEG